MVRIFPLIFILLWSSAFITTKPIIDNSDPFSALAFRFALVAMGFFLFSIYSKKKIIVAIIIRERIENFWLAPLCKRAERKAILKSSLLTDIYSFKNKLIFR